MDGFPGTRAFDGDHRERNRLALSGRRPLGNDCPDQPFCLAAPTRSRFFCSLQLGRLWHHRIVIPLLSEVELFVFGSGLAIVPFLHGGVVQDHHWLTETQFLDAVAVAMITPGPVVITVAFIGYLVSGMMGASAAALGVFLPVYLFVVIVGPLYRRFSKNEQIRAFVQGVTAAATGAIAGAVVVLGKHSIHDYWTAGIAVTTFLILIKWKIPEPLIIAVAGLLGIAIHFR